MNLFKSSREKRLWIYAFLVCLAIFSTLFLGRPLLDFFGEQRIQGIVFGVGMVLVGVTVLIHGLRIGSAKMELFIVLGIFAVYLMLFLRLGLPERSHLIEYSVLAILVYEALIERINPAGRTLKPALIAFTIIFAMGTLDECTQIFVPGRVFDTTDILFNGLAAFMALAASVILTWLSKRPRT